MSLFGDIVISENQKRAAREVSYAIDSINEIYKEWKKINRRRNAVNIVTTSVNKLCTIDPTTIDHIHDAGKIKLTTILMRCMDIAPWSNLDNKRNTYRRLYTLIDKMQAYSPNTGTGGSLRDVIMTRLSTCVCFNSEGDKKQVFVAYEPKITTEYINFLFGSQKPEKVYKMQALPLPEDFDKLVNTLKINHTKACDKYFSNPNDIFKEIQI